MSFMQFLHFVSEPAHPLMAAYLMCDATPKSTDTALEKLFSLMESDPNLHRFVTTEESFFLEDVNELIGKYPEGIESHYSMRLSRIAYDVAEKLNAEGHQEAKSYREWAPKVERFPQPKTP